MNSLIIKVSLLFILTAAVINNNSCYAQVGVNNGSVDLASVNEYCDSYASRFILKNLGSDTLSSAIIELMVNGALIETINWTGSLLTDQSQQLFASPYFSTVDLNIELSMTSVNGTVDDDPSDNTETRTITLAPFFPYSSGLYELHIQVVPSATDYLSWSIRDDAGIVLQNGGGLNVYDSDTLYIETVTLPPAGGCFILNASTNFFTIEEEDYYIELFDGLGQSMLSYNGQIFSFLDMHFKIDSFSSSTNIHELVHPEIKIFPNPADLIINLIGDFNYQHLEIYSMSGNRVFHTNETNESINVETLPNGTYMIRLSDGRTTYTQKLIILR